MGSGKIKIFISYKRNVEPDDRIAHQIFEALSAMPSTEVFMDIKMGIGVPWAQRIEQEIKAADFLISFLSQASVQSEMVVAEIETAHHWGKEHGNPKILPVRLNYKNPLEYPLSAYLNPLNWETWKSDSDTAMLVSKLIVSISASQAPAEQAPSQAVNPAGEAQEHISFPSTQSPSAVPIPSAQPFELPEGTMRPDSAYYIERNSDALALDAIRKHGVTITIKGPRQIGKSSLLMRVMDQAKIEGKGAIFIDFQLFDATTRSDPENFFKRFTQTIVRKLKLPNEINSFWDEGMGHSQLCTEYMEDYILPKLESPILLAMDEVESVFESVFRTDFFSMLRVWHNSRALSSKWGMIDLALVTSTEPYQFIEDLNQSPFNVGVIVNIEDFTQEQVTQVNECHQQPLSRGQVIDLYDLLGGHPYLTRRAIYLIGANQISYAELMDTASDWNGPFGDHLRYHLFRLQRNPKFVSAMRAITSGATQIDEDIFHRLRGAGLVKRNDNRVISRCMLYAEFFKEYLND